MEDQVKSRKRWSKEEVLVLLRCYAARKDEFTHFRGQKMAYQNVLEDMVYQGITDSSTTAEALKNKIRTLLDAYKSAKDNNKKTGAAPVIVPYMTELDEIFGDKPIVSKNHTLHLGVPLAKKHTQELKTRSQENAQLIEYTDFEALEEEIIQGTQTSSPESSSPSIAPVEIPTTSIARKRKTAREIYFEGKLQIKREAMEAAKAASADFLQSVEKGFKEKWQKESEDSKTRIQILKEIQKTFQK